ncbi:hypothetical protein AGMMS49975_09370 [Clostridia bacterium]|nr:hypothetical protein AGMMS49975_09370 [Clostridia bacterium]
MEYNITPSYNEEENVWFVTLVGEFDIFNAAELKAKLNDLVAEKQINLVLECSNLVFIDSTVLGNLVAVLKNVKAYDGKISLKNLRPNVSKIFKITNLNKIFVIDGEGEANE